MGTRKTRSGIAADDHTSAAADDDTAMSATSPSSAAASAPRISALLWATQQSNRPDSISSSASASACPPLVAVSHIVGPHSAIPSWTADAATATTYWSAMRAEEQRVGLRLFLEQDNVDRVRAAVADSGDKYNTRMKRAQVAMEPRVGGKFSRPWMNRLLAFWHSLPQRTRAALVQRCQEFVACDSNDRLLLKAAGQLSSDTDSNDAADDERPATQTTARRLKRRRAANAAHTARGRKEWRGPLTTNVASHAGSTSAGRTAQRADYASSSSSKPLTSAARQSPAHSSGAALSLSGDEQKEPQRSSTVPSHSGQQSTQMSSLVKWNSASPASGATPAVPLSATAASNSSNASLHASASTSSTTPEPPAVRFPTASVAGAASAAESASSGARPREAASLLAYVERMTAVRQRAMAARDRYSKEEAAWHEQAMELEQYTRQLDRAERDALQWKRERSEHATDMQREKEQLLRWKAEVQAEAARVQRERAELEHVRTQQLTELEQHKRAVWSRLEDNMHDMIRLRERIAELEGNQHSQRAGHTAAQVQRRWTFTSTTLPETGRTGLEATNGTTAAIAGPPVAPLVPHPSPPSIAPNSSPEAPRSTAAAPTPASLVHLPSSTALAARSSFTSSSAMHAAAARPIETALLG